MLIKFDKQKVLYRPRRPESSVAWARRSEARVARTPAAETRPCPRRVRVRGASVSKARPRPRRVRVQGASVSALDLARLRSSRVRVRWCPHPSRVRVRWRPLRWMSASTGMSVRTSAGRPRPWPSFNGMSEYRSGRDESAHPHHRRGYRSPLTGCGTRMPCSTDVR